MTKQTSEREIAEQFECNNCQRSFLTFNEYHNPERCPYCGHHYLFATNSFYIEKIFEDLPEDEEGDNE